MEEVQLDAVLLLLQKKKFIDYEIFTYVESFTVEQVLYLITNLGYYEDFLAYKLVCKIEETLYIPRDCPPKLAEIITQFIGIK